MRLLNLLNHVRLVPCTNMKFGYHISNNKTGNELIVICAARRRCHCNLRVGVRVMWSFWMKIKLINCLVCHLVTRVRRLNSINKLIFSLTIKFEDLVIIFAHDFIDPRHEFLDICVHTGHWNEKSSSWAGRMQIENWKCVYTYDALAHNRCPMTPGQSMFFVRPTIAWADHRYRLDTSLVRLLCIQRTKIHRVLFLDGRLPGTIFGNDHSKSPQRPLPAKIKTFHGSLKNSSGM